jgi:hypothetical protein
VTAEPVAYLRHRTAFFVHFMTSLDYVFHEGNDAEDVQQHLQGNVGFRVLRQYVLRADGLWMFRPGFWLVLAGICVLAARFCPQPSRRFVGALGLSSLVYLGTYFFVGVGANFRYAYWAVLATGAASVVLLCELAAALRRLAVSWRSSAPPRLA